MNKLKLQLEDLLVDSFQTTPAERPKGTVFGEQCTCYTQCTCPGCPTCDGTCPNTCANTCDDPSCAGTCGATCDWSCGGAGTCAVSCNVSECNTQCWQGNMCVVW
jgi:hypothetical protein